MRRAAIHAVNKLVAEHGLPAQEAVAVKRFFNSRSLNPSASALSLDSGRRLALASG